MEIRPREVVIFAENFKKLAEWYQNILDFTIVNLYEDDFHYCYLENENGIKIGIADAKEMGVTPTDRNNNTVIMQIEVPDVKIFFKYLQENEGIITFGPSFDKKSRFWFGGFTDLEGNPIWVVDKNCP